MNIEALHDELNELQKKLVIDKYHLDDVVIEHPTLISEIGYFLSRASAAKDSAKAKMENTYAEIANQIRMEASVHEGRYQGLKLTESRIDAEVKMDENYIKRVNQYNKLRELESKAQSLKDSFESRGRMIKILVDLYLAQYWSTTAPKHQADAEVKRLNDAEVNSVRQRQALHRNLRNSKNND